MFGPVLSAQEPLDVATLIGVVIFAVVAFLFVAVAVVVRHLKRVPPNRVLVIFGKAGRAGEAAVCVHGGAKLIIPLIQDYRWLSLEPIRVEVSRQITSSGKKISDPLPRVFSVAIGTTDELMQTAANRLVGLTANEIKKHAEDIIVARLDRLIDAIEAGDYQPGTDEFHQVLENSLQPELAQLGLVLINFRRE